MLHVCRRPHLLDMHAHVHVHVHMQCAMCTCICRPHLLEAKRLIAAHLASIPGEMVQPKPSMPKQVPSCSQQPRRPPLLRPSCLLRAVPLGSRGGPSLLRGRGEAPAVLWCLPSRRPHRLWPYQEGGGRPTRVGGGVAADHREGGRVRGHVELEQSWRVECCTLDCGGRYPK